MDLKTEIREYFYKIHGSHIETDIANIIAIAEKHIALQLQQTGVIVQSEKLKTCEHNFADVYDHTGTQIIGKKCLNGCGF